MMARRDCAGEGTNVAPLLVKLFLRAAWLSHDPTAEIVQNEKRDTTILRLESVGARITLTQEAQCET